MVLVVVEIGPQLLNHTGVAPDQLIHMMQYLLEGIMEHLVMHTVKRLLMGKVGHLVLCLMTCLKACVLVKVMCMMDLLVADIVRELFLLLSDHFVAVHWWDSFDYDFVWPSQYY